MQKTDILKNKNIFIAILLLGFLFVAYKYSILNLKAANLYSCNHYIGRCLIDNSFGKSNNLETCNEDCFKKRYKLWECCIPVNGHGIFKIFIYWRMQAYSWYSLRGFKWRGIFKSAVCCHL